ncbi:MAG: signal peptidase II [Pseudomonadota bacterium]
MILRIVVPVAIVAFLIDQVSKWWVTGPLGLGWDNRDYPVWPPFLQFRYAENTGINFGLFGGGPEETRYILVAVKLIISAALIVWVWRRRSTAIAWGAGLVVGGAMANAWDRFSHGAVIDFLNNACCGFDNPFSYNIADVWIFAGALWIAIKA